MDAPLDHALVCDDHPLVAQALAAMLGARFPAARIATAGDFPAAWAAAAAGPDLCLVDLDMPGARPHDGVAGVVAAAPAARIVIITGLSDEHLLRGLLALGIAGIVPKTAGVGVIGGAIDLVMAGGRYLPPRAVALADAMPPLERLSPRQVEVARLLAAGLTNKDIARTLGVAPATIKTHVAQVLATLGATNRTEAAGKLRAGG